MSKMPLYFILLILLTNANGQDTEITQLPVTATEANMSGSSEISTGISTAGEEVSSSTSSNIITTVTANISEETTLPSSGSPTTSVIIQSSESQQGINDSEISEPEPEPKENEEEKNEPQSEVEPEPNSEAEPEPEPESEPEPEPENNPEPVSEDEPSPEKEPKSIKPESRELFEEISNSTDSDNEDMDFKANMTDNNQDIYTNIYNNTKTSMRKGEDDAPKTEFRLSEPDDSGSSSITSDITIFFITIFTVFYSCSKT